MDFKEIRGTIFPASAVLAGLEIEYQYWYHYHLSAMIYMASECKLLYHPLTIRAINPSSEHKFKNLDSKGNPMHKKLFFGLLLFSLVTVILAGCGIVDVATTPSGTSTPGAQTTATTGGGGGASQHFGAPTNMTTQRPVTFNISLPPSRPTCTPPFFIPPILQVKS